MVHVGKLDQPSISDASKWVNAYGSHTLADEMVTLLEQHGYMEREMCEHGIQTLGTVVTERGIALWEFLTITLLVGPIQNETVGDFDHILWNERYSDMKAIEGAALGNALKSLFRPTDGEGTEESS
jgi:hypothetical protein